MKRAKTRALVEVQGKTTEKKLMLNNDNDNNRKLLENCQLKGKRVLNPIIDWTDDEVWEFLHYYGCESNPLYQCGYKRIGCVGCPMSTKRRQEFDRYPKYRENYIRTFEKMINHEFYDTHPRTWETGEEVFEWWVSDTKKSKQIEGQMSLILPDLYGEEEDG